MSTIKVLDKTFVKFIPNSRIVEAVQRIAGELNRDFQGKDPLFLAILNGAFMFAGELFHHLSMPCRVSFVKMASYMGTGSTGEISQLIGLQESIVGQSVIILEDIVDTGLTFKKLLAHLESLNPAEVKIASLLFKPDAFKSDFKIDYLGLTIPNDFVVGFGLDYNGYGRNYPDIYHIVK